MNKLSIGLVVLGIVAGVIIAPVIYLRVHPLTMESMSIEIYDNFIEQIIPHHEDAITMADLASTRAEHAEIKKLAINIKKTQSEEIAQMKSWYKEWYGKEVPSLSGGDAMMHGGMMSGGRADLEDLKTSKPFDKEFIQEMIPHHLMAVMMAQMLVVSTSRPEMRTLAENIISAQNKEIGEMKEWYALWYK
ncbi:MAG: DUF305 domain-containing protein [Patescibacteria group bacterium]